MYKNLIRPFQFILLLFHLSITIAAYSQCPTGLGLSSSNLIINGDFSDGNTAFTSLYSYCNTAGCLSPEGTYTVAADPSFYEPMFEGSDHTSGTGSFLIANGATTSNTSVWCQTVPVDPNSYYEISYWVSSMDTQSPAQIQILINTFPFFQGFNAPTTTNTWKEFSEIWVSGITTSANVCLINTKTSATGNDFGIDDISMKKCECDIAIEAAGGGSICKGDSIQLLGTGAGSYYWTPTTDLSCFICDTPKASPDSTTIYTVTALGPGGCTVTDSVEVIVYPVAGLQAEPDTGICFGEVVQLNASGAVSYQWSPSSGLSNAFIANPIANPASDVTYFLTAIDQYGCSLFDSVSITVFAPPLSVVTNADTIICKGSVVLLQVNQSGTVSWLPSDNLSCSNCLQPLAAPDSTTTYVVSVTDINECFAGTDSVTIEIDTNCNENLTPSAIIPTAFSPNLDGKNDFFNVLGNGITNYQLDVYNRWGELVFTTNTQDAGWDGTYNGEQQEVGVYIWHLEGSMPDGTIVNKNGSVTLIR